MDGVKRISRKGATTNHASSMDHRRLQKSSTLNRRFVRRPVAKAQTATKAAQSGQTKKQTQRQASKAGSARAIVTTPQVTRKGGLIQRTKRVRLNRVQTTGVQTKSTQAMRQKTQTMKSKTTAGGQKGQARQVQNAKQVSQQQDVGVQDHKLLKVTRARMSARQAAAPVPISSQEMKDRAIQQALQRMQSAEKTKADFGQPKEKKLHFWQKKSFVAAASMAIISIALLGYLVSLNLPDLSVRVAAMQAGIANAYPSYVPSNYRLDGLVKEENGRITMNFRNDIGKSFTLTEEKSSWDSAAVLANYVKKNWGDDYSIAKGQGLTIYVSNSKAVWVNGGVLYIVDGEAAELNSSDLHDIAVSL